MCQHQPSCPAADAPDHAAARAVSRHPEQGWSLLCNGVLVFDDTGELLPNGRIVPPHRPTDQWDPATGRDEVLAGTPAAAMPATPEPVRRPRRHLVVLTPAAA